MKNKILIVSILVLLLASFVFAQKICDDSDHTIYTKKGTVIYEGKEYVDFCTDNILTEYVCQGDFFFNREITCPSSCEDGACMPTDVKQGFYIKEAKLDKINYIPGKDKFVVVTVIVLDEDGTSSTAEEGTIVWYSLPRKSDEWFAPALKMSYDSNNEYFQVKIPLEQLGGAGGYYLSPEIDNLARGTGGLSSQGLNFNVLESVCRTEYQKEEDLSGGLPLSYEGLGLICEEFSKPISLDKSNSIGFKLWNYLDYNIKDVKITIDHCDPVEYNKKIKKGENHVFDFSCKLSTNFYGKMTITYLNPDDEIKTVKGEVAAIIPEFEEPDYIENCIDSDDLDYNQKGVLTYTVNGLEHKSPDFCDSNKVLTERKCAEILQNSYEEHICQGICLDGACILPTVCPTKIEMELNKEEFLLGNLPTVSIRTYDSNDNAIESIVNAYLYKDDSLIESASIEIPKNGFKFDTKELIKDIERLKVGTYKLKFDTEVSGCTAQNSKTFEIKESMSMWTKFINFLKSLFS